MAYEVGSAFVQLVPTFTGVAEQISAEATKWGDSAGQAFADTFKARVEASLSDLPNAKITADTSEVEAKIAAIRAELETLTNDKVEFDFDDGEASAQIALLHAQLIELGALRPDVAVEVDGDRAAAEIAALDAESVGLGGGLKDISDASDGASGGLGGLGASASGALPEISGLAAGIGALATALLPIGGLALGALSALPALVAGAASGIGALKLGLSGIGGAISAVDKTHGPQLATGGSGTGNSAAIQAISDAEQERNATESVTNATRELANAKTNAAAATVAANTKVETAERSLTSALQTERNAQQGLVQARQDAQDQLQSYNDQLADGALQAQQLQFALAQAQAALVADQASGANPTTLYGDQLAISQAQQAVKDQSDQYAVLQRNAAAAQAQGIGDAPGVIAAQQQVSSAVQGVADAHKAVRDANDQVSQAQITGAQNVAQAERAVNVALQDQADTIKRIGLEQAAGASGGSSAAASPAAAAAAALAALTPAGRAFVEYVTGPLENTINDLKKKAQDALLPGLLTGLKDLAPVFTSISPFIVQAASGIGELAKGLGQFLSSKAGLSDITAIFKSGAGFMSDLGKAAVPFFTAIGSIGKDAAPIVTQLGDAIGSIVKDFANWVTNGGFDGFLKWLKDNGPGLLNDMESFAKLVGNVVTTLAPLAVVFDDVVGWISKMLDELFKLNPLLGALGVAFLVVGTPVEAVIAAVVLLGVGIEQLVTHWKTVWGVIKQAADDAWHFLYNNVFGPISNFFTNTIPSAFDTVVGFFQALPDRLVSALGDVVSKVWSGLVVGATWLFDHVSTPLLDFFGGIPLAIYDAITGKGNILDTIFGDIISGLGASGTWLEDHVWTPIASFFGSLAKDVYGVLTKDGNFLDRIFKDVLAGLGKGWTWLVTNVGTPLHDFFTGLPGDILKALESAGNFLDQIFADIVKGLGAGGTWLVDHIWDPISAFFTGLPGDIAKAAKGVWDGLGDAFLDVINGIIHIWDDLHFTIPSVIPGIGGHQIGLGHIDPIKSLPGFAEGGDFAGGLAMVGENGPELVHFQTPVHIDTAAITAAAFGGGYNGRSGPAVVLNDPIFKDEADINMLMRQASFQVAAGGL